MLELLHKVLFSLITGVSEFLFASASAHQLLYQTVTGYQMTDPLTMLMIRLGCLLALVLVCYPTIKRIRYERRLARPSRRRRSRNPDPALMGNIRILNTAVVPVLLSCLVYRQVRDFSNSLIWMALFSLLYAVVLFVPQFLPSADKDGKSFTPPEGLLIGLSGSLGYITGFGGLGSMFSVARMRGAGAQYALDMGLMICIPLMLVLAGFDMYEISQAALQPTAFDLIGYILAGVSAFFGAKLSVGLIRKFSEQRDLSVFAYYHLGLAFFTLLIYLIIP